MQILATIATAAHVQYTYLQADNSKIVTIILQLSIQLCHIKII